MHATQFNIKSWKHWAMVIGAIAIGCAIDAGLVHFWRMTDEGYHPIVEDITEIIGWIAITCLIALAVGAGRQFSMAWARRLFWLNIISLVLFALVTLLIWMYFIGWMPFSVKLIGGALFQLSLFVCFWSFCLSWGMISRQTLRRQGFYILFVATPPVLFVIWLLETAQTGPLNPG
jgi:hypothetical protein